VNIQHHWLLACQAKAPADQHEADQRDHGKQALPAHLAQARVLPVAPVVGKDAQRMDAEEDQQAGDQQGHGACLAQKGASSIGEYAS
jgi:hypothetical protein